MAEDLEQQLRAAREQGQLQAAQSKVKDLRHCVALQETELQQLRRSLEARQHAEDLLKAELRMSSTMHKAIRPPIHLAFASTPSAPRSASTPVHLLAARYTSPPERVAAGGRPLTAAPPRRLSPIEPALLCPSPAPTRTSSRLRAPGGAQAAAGAV